MPRSRPDVESDRPRPYDVQHTERAPSRPRSPREEVRDTIIPRGKEEARDTIIPRREKDQSRLVTPNESKAGLLQRIDSAMGKHGGLTNRNLQIIYDDLASDKISIREAKEKFERMGLGR
jgi:hypothetical protein